MLLASQERLATYWAAPAPVTPQPSSAVDLPLIAGAAGAAAVAATFLALMRAAVARRRHGTGCTYMPVCVSGDERQCAACNVPAYGNADGASGVAKVTKYYKTWPKPGFKSFLQGALNRAPATGASASPAATAVQDESNRA